jgi:hypothetical protein
MCVEGKEITEEERIKLDYVYFKPFKSVTIPASVETWGE